MIADYIRPDIAGNFPSSFPRIFSHFPIHPFFHLVSENERLHMNVY
jgi:hypothetical protein